MSVICREKSWAKDSFFLLLYVNDLGAGYKKEQ
jgi:hypothetical protein